MFGQYSSNTLDFTDLDGDFSQMYSLSTRSAQDPLAISVTPPDPIEKSSGIRPKDVHRPSRAKFPERPTTGTTDPLVALDSSKSVASDLSTATTVKYIPSMTAIPPFKCGANGRGWLNALHLAAQQGHTGIVRIRKTPLEEPTQGPQKLMNPPSTPPPNFPTQPALLQQGVCDRQTEPLTQGDTLQCYNRTWTATSATATA